MKKFHVVIDMGGKSIIDITRKEKNVDEWVDLFQKKNIPGSSLKVYLVGGHNVPCSLVYQESYPMPIGFGNW